MTHCGFWTATALFFLASPANAQRIFGSVVQADGKTVARGAIVTAFDVTGVVAGRELTSVRGDYVMPLAKPGTYTITVQHVGDGTERVEGVVVGVDADVRKQVVLAHPARRPAQVATRTGTSCALASDTTGLATLWEQLQTALATTSIAEYSKTFMATWTLDDLELDAGMRDTLNRSSHDALLPISIPVYPVPTPDSAIAHGFVIEATDGVRYQVPGPMLLRAPTFAERRCFAFEPAPDNQPGWIGLHFWSEAHRFGFTDLEGTFWFDAASLEPRAITFLYVGLPPAFARAHAGGGMRFAELPTGHWVMDEWTIRAPAGRYRRLFAYDARGRPTAYGNLSLDGVLVSTGHLQNLTVNGTSIFRRP